MTKKINILLFTHLLSIATFIYLTVHHYSVKLGLGGASLCQLNAKFNCDTAALSSYSEIFNIPIASIGLSYHIVALSVLLLFKLGWLESTKSLAATIKGTAIFASLVSVVLFIVSMFSLQVICPFCLLSYVLAFIIMYLSWDIFKTDSFTEGFKDIFTHDKSYLSFFIAIPVLAWFGSGTINDSYGLSEIAKLVPEKVMQWQASPVQSFNYELGLTKGATASNSPTLIEFADFKCPHCKTASLAFKNVLRTNQNVKFIFKPYPLDGVCNTHIAQKGDGSRCELAGWALCGEKLFQKGWEVHDWIFENQELMAFSSDLAPYLEQLSKELNIDSAQLKLCSTSAETFALIQKTADEGQAAKITGTPTIFLNNKKLEGAQFTDILKGALNTLN